MAAIWEPELETDAQPSVRVMALAGVPVAQFGRLVRGEEYELPAKQAALLMEYGFAIPMAARQRQPEPWHAFLSRWRVRFSQSV
jgi:hypothetical protein